MKYLYSIGLLVIFLACLKKETRSTQVHEAIVMTNVDLGKKLFFDPILSSDKSIACASCHQPKFAYADNKAFSLGVNDSL